MTPLSSQKKKKRTKKEKKKKEKEKPQLNCFTNDLSETYFTYRSEKSYSHIPRNVIPQYIHSVILLKTKMFRLLEQLLDVAGKTLAIALPAPYIKLPELQLFM